MALEGGQNGGQSTQRGIRRRGRIRVQSRRREVFDHDQGLGSSKHSLKDRQADGKSKRNIFDLFKGKGKDIRSIVPPILTPLIPPALLPPVTSEILTIPTPEPVLSSPPETTSGIETQPIETQPPTTEPASVVTLTPLIPSPETTPETTTTARPIFVPQFPPPVDIITTEIPGSGVITIELPPQQSLPVTAEPFTPPGSSISSQASVVPSASSRSTFITLTSAISTSTTSVLGIPEPTESPTNDTVGSSSSSGPAGRTAGIVVGTILAVMPIIALVYFWFRRRRRRQSAGTYEEKPPEETLNLFRRPVEKLGVTIGGFFGRCRKDSTRNDGNPEVGKPEPIHQRSTRRFEETKHEPIPDITLTAVVEEGGSRTGSPLPSPGMGQTKSGSTRIVIARKSPGSLSRQQSPRYSFLAEQTRPRGGGGDGTSSHGTAEGTSRSNTPYRDRTSTISDISTSWMTTATQKTDGEFVPTTALRYPGGPRPSMPQEQRLPVQGEGVGGQQRGPSGTVPGPSKWLSPPSWRVMARRSLTRSQKSDDGRSRSSRSDSDKSQGLPLEKGSRRYM
ncbi:hypothetical protein V8F20_002464 [Naviculisporaceae sp. PSN 640]